jgi:hypothetical protein
MSLNETNLQEFSRIPRDQHVDESAQAGIAEDLQDTDFSPERDMKRRRVKGVLKDPQDDQ